MDAVLAQKNQRDKLININLSKNDGKILVSFEDNGGGIPKELLPDKIFESYISTKGESGTGIGLSICKSIIENGMGGKISARNTDKGALVETSLLHL